MRNFTTIGSLAAFEGGGVRQVKKIRESEL
jgi:hypothetical protein